MPLVCGIPSALLNCPSLYVSLHDPTDTSSALAPYTRQSADALAIVNVQSSFLPPLALRADPPSPARCPTSPLCSPRAAPSEPDNCPCACITNSQASHHHHLRCMCRPRNLWSAMPAHHPYNSRPWGTQLVVCADDDTGGCRWYRRRLGLGHPCSRRARHGQMRIYRGRGPWRRRLPHTMGTPCALTRLLWAAPHAARAMLS